MLTDELTSRLLPDERVLWSGRPKQGLLFTSRDIFMVPFSILWGGFAIFWEVMAISITPKIRAVPSHASFAIPVVFPLFGAAFVCVGLFMMFGRFFIDAQIRRNTLYAVTDRRVLILRSGIARKFIAIGLDRIPNVTLSEGRADHGTIRFGESALASARNWGTWMPSLDPLPQFLQIENARALFDQIQGLSCDRVPNRN